MRSVVLVFSIGILILLVNSGNWLADQLTLLEEDPFLQTSLTRLIDQEMKDKGIPGLAISVIDDQNTLFESGFGKAQIERDIPVSPYTVFQGGAIAQLFTTIGILQRVEHDKLDLDAPIATYLESFSPENPYGLPLTIRQILSHQSGLVTEPPVGHYFDETSPSLANTVESINQTTIVYPPETFTKYSNAGFAVAGLILEQSVEKSFAQHMRAILDRMHLKRTSFTARLDLRNKLADGHVRTLDDRLLVAPAFEAPNAPANNVYTTVNDLGAFLRVLFANGLSPNGVILDADSFEQMWTIQLSTARKELPYGLGFAVSIFDGARRATLTGDVHGFSVRIDLLPDQDIGVALLTNVEHVNASLEKISSYALRVIMAQHNEKATPPFPFSHAPDSLMVARATGYYQNQDPLYVAKTGKELFLYKDFERYKLRQTGDSLIIDDRHAYGKILISDGLTLEYENTLYSKRNNSLPAVSLPRFQDFLGAFGNLEAPISFVEKNEILFAMDGWHAVYPLNPLSADTFSIPVDGMYGGEEVAFLRDESNAVQAVNFANMVLPRIKETENVITITSLPLGQSQKPSKKHVTTAPPVFARQFVRSSEIVDLTMVDPLLNLDIKYATTDNLVATKLYEESRALLQRPVAEAVFRIQRQVRRMGYDLVIYDTYQPWHITNNLWQRIPDTAKYFFDDPSIGSCQNNGTAISLNLFDLNTGERMPMPTDYGIISTKTRADYPHPNQQLRWNRDFLRHLMELEGFTISATKWWHFTHNTCKLYPLMDDSFAEIDLISLSNLQRIFTVDR